MNKNLVHRLKKPAEIKVEDQLRMFRLMDENYDCVEFSAFTKDLSAKDYVSLLIDKNKDIQGFSTYALNPSGTGSGHYNILFSGDTIINPGYWGSRIMAKSWAEVVGGLLKKYPEKKLYWLLISKGHRTFMYLPIFFSDFVPHFNMSGKEELNEIARKTAVKIFGEYYQADTGVIRFERSQGQLKKSLAHKTHEKQRNEWVSFFLKKNPDFGRGVELVCLAEISEANLKPVAWRMICQGMEQPVL